MADAAHFDDPFTGFGDHVAPAILTHGAIDLSVAGGAVFYGLWGSMPVGAWRASAIAIGLFLMAMRVIVSILQYRVARAQLRALQAALPAPKAPSNDDTPRSPPQ